MELSLIKEQILLGHLPNFHKEIQAKILGTEGNLELQNQLRHFSLESLILISIQPKKKIFYTKIHPLENMALGALRNSFTIIDINANINKSTDEVAANNKGFYNI